MAANSEDSMPVSRQILIRAKKGLYSCFFWRPSGCNALTESGILRRRPGALILWCGRPYIYIQGWSDPTKRLERGVEVRLGSAIITMVQSTQVAPVTIRDLKVGSELCQRVFPSRVQDTCDRRGNWKPLTGRSQVFPGEQTANTFCGAFLKLGRCVKPFGPKA